MPNRQPWTRRHIRRSLGIAGAGVACLLVGMALVFSIDASGGSFLGLEQSHRKSIAMAAITLMVACGGAVLIEQLLVFRPAQRRVSEARGRVCGSCLFGLDGMPDQGECPECGEAYELASTIEGWQHDLDESGW